MALALPAVPVRANNSAPLMQRSSTGAGAFNIKSYGAACDAAPDGSSGTDDTAAVQATIDAAAAAGGGTILVPGHTKCAGQINLDNKHNIVLQGLSGSGAGYSLPPPTQLIYTGQGSSAFISAAHSNGIAFRDLGIRYTSASFSGDLVALTNLTSPNTPDAAFGLVERCLIGGINVHSARTCISLEGAILCSIVDNHLQWAASGIRGSKHISTGNNLYSNGHYLGRNTFDNLTVGAIVNPANNWTIVSNWFEGTDGGTGGMPYAICSDLPAEGCGCGSLAYIGNWHGDATNVHDAWINFGNMPGNGLHIAGNSFFTLNPASIPAMRFPTTIQGASITGNYVSSYIDLVGADHYGLSISGNFYTNEVANISSASTDLWIVANKKDGGFAKTYMRVANPQDINLGSTAA